MNIMSSWLTINDPNAPTDPANTYYSPGTLGFIFVFFLAVAAVFLIFDMVRRVRRLRYRAEIEAKLAAETAAKRKKTDQ